MMGVDPLWFGIMIAINLQTSFLTPLLDLLCFTLEVLLLPQLEPYLYRCNTFRNYSAIDVICSMAFSRISYLSTKNNL